MSGHIQPGPIRAELLHGTFPSVRIAGAFYPHFDAVQRNAWAELCDANPSLHDGPIWTVDDATAGQLTVRKARYRHLALQRHADMEDLGIRLLGVRGITVAMRAGEPHILIARRGWRVRIYPNMWETAPAGGVDAHADLSEQLAAQTLVNEARQELGVDAASSLSSVRFVALLHDPTAQSVELVAVLAWPVPLDEDWRLPPHREEAWEYSAAKWVPLTRIPRLMSAASSSEIAPPARWVLQNARTLLT